MTSITFGDLHPLLKQFAGQGMVLSFYTGLGVREGFRPEWQAPFKAKVDEFVKVIGDDGRAHEELEENAAAIREALGHPGLAGARWAAAFSAARRGFLKVFPLDVPVETELVLDRSPYLVPLLEAILRRREFLVVHTDTHRGRIYAATPGETELLSSLDEEVPAKQHSAGETWGYGQATIGRHREDRIMHYRKELVVRLERFWDAGRFSELILLGEHEVIQHVRDELPERMAAHIVCEEPESWYERESQVEEKIRSLVQSLDREHELGPSADFWDRLREGKAVAAGPRAVIDALQGGQIEPEGHGYLVFGPDPRESVGRCVACRSLSPEPLGPCPKCQAPCAPGNLWEELMLTALQHGIACRFVHDAKKLEAHGGVVAVLAQKQR